jgi:hypothetical protein
MSNSIMVIAPYLYNGTWVFDDPEVGLSKEPFVAGIPEMIETITADIPDAEDGFSLCFSALPFPGYQQELSWVRAESGGNWYRSDELGGEGWLCPAMFKYFDEAPETLYVGVGAINKRKERFVSPLSVGV